MRVRISDSWISLVDEHIIFDPPALPNPTVKEVPIYVFLTGQLAWWCVEPRAALHGRWMVVSAH